MQQETNPERGIEFIKFVLDTMSQKDNFNASMTMIQSSIEEIGDLSSAFMVAHLPTIGPRAGMVGFCIVPLNEIGETVKEAHEASGFEFSNEISEKIGYSLLNNSMYYHEVVANNGAGTIHLSVTNLLMLLQSVVGAGFLGVVAEAEGAVH